MNENKKGKIIKICTVAGALCLLAVGGTFTYSAIAKEDVTPTENIAVKTTIAPAITTTTTTVTTTTVPTTTAKPTEKTTEKATVKSTVKKTTAKKVVSTTKKKVVSTTKKVEPYIGYIDHGNKIYYIGSDETWDDYDKNYSSKGYIPICLSDVWAEERNRQHPNHPDNRDYSGDEWAW